MSTGKLSENHLKRRAETNLTNHTQSSVHVEIHFKEETHEAENFTSFLTSKQFVIS